MSKSLRLENQRCISFFVESFSLKRCKSGNNNVVIFRATIMYQNEFFQKQLDRILTYKFECYCVRRVLFICEICYDVMLIKQ